MFLSSNPTQIPEDESVALSWTTFLSSGKEVYHKQSKVSFSCSPWRVASAAPSLQTPRTSASFHPLPEGVSQISRESDTTFDAPGCHNFVTYSELERMLPRLLWDDTLTITCEVAVTSFASSSTAPKEASHSGSIHHDTHSKRRAILRNLADSSDEEEVPQPPKAKKSKLKSSRRPAQSAAGHTQPATSNNDDGDEPTSQGDEEEETSVIPFKKGEVKALS